MKRPIKIILFSIIWLLTSISFVQTHLTNDFFVFWGWAKQVSISEESGLSALVSTWEIKGLLSRLFYYDLYSITTLFTDKFDLMGQCIYKTIAYIQLNLVLLIAIIAIPQQYIKDTYTKIVTFLVCSILLMGIHFSSHLQPEYIATYFIILSFTLYLRGNILSKILSGIIFASTFYLKSPILIMGGSIYFSILLVKKSSFIVELKKFTPFIVSFILFLISTLLIIRIYYPQELTDIQDAAYYQNTLIHTPSLIGRSIITCLKNLLLNVWFLPVLLLGGITTIQSIILFLREKNINEFIYLIAIWLFPVLYISISNCFFIYHYYILIYPALISIYINRNNIVQTLDKHLLIISMLIAICIVFNIDNILLNGNKKWIVLSLLLFGLSTISYLKKATILLSCISMTLIYMEFLSSNSSTIKEGNKLYNQWYKEQNIAENKEFEQQNKMMYLDGGMGIFIFDNKSYLRYGYPLPIQRIDESNSPFIHRETFNLTKTKILNYNENYLVLDDKWFYRYNHPEIEKYLSTKWELYKEIPVPSFSWELVPLKPLTFSNISLLKKKIILQ